LQDFLRQLVYLCVADHAQNHETRLLALLLAGSSLLGAECFVNAGIGRPWPLSIPWS